ncbi:MAG: hypothetical protein ACP5DY_06985, partial [Thermovirgaceae bacterium]
SRAPSIASGVVRPVPAGSSTGVVVAGSLSGVRPIPKTRIAAPVTVIAAAAFIVVVIIVVACRAAVPVVIIVVTYRAAVPVIIIVVITCRAAVPVVIVAVIIVVVITCRAAVPVIVIVVIIIVVVTIVVVITCRAAVPVIVIVTCRAAVPVIVIVVIIIVVTCKSNHLANPEIHQKFYIILGFFGSHQVPVANVLVSIGDYPWDYKGFDVLESIGHVTGRYQPCDGYVNQNCSPEKSANFHLSHLSSMESPFFSLF